MHHGNYWLSPDTEWTGKSGLVIETVGYLDKHRIYKTMKHRILRQYALVYLVHGDGIFVSKSVKERQIHAGDLLLLMPGERHRYGPREGEQWIEYFVMFDGFIPRTHQANGTFDPARPVVQTGQSPEIRALFANLLEKASERQTGYAESMLANLFRIIAKGFISPPPREGASDRLVESIKNALAIRFQGAVDIRQVLESTGYCYGYARRVFQEHIGLSPSAYLTRLRMGEAKKLLSETDLSSAEIGYRVGLEDPAYFCRVFKKWVGLSPSTFRKEGLAIRGSAQTKNTPPFVASIVPQ